MFAIRILGLVFSLGHPTLILFSRINPSAKKLSDKLAPGFLITFIKSREGLSPNLKTASTTNFENISFSWVTNFEDKVVLAILIKSL